MRLLLRTGNQRVKCWSVHTAIIVGMAYSSYVPILPSITRTLFGRNLFGRVWGLISMGGSIGQPWEVG